MFNLVIMMKMTRSIILVQGRKQRKSFNIMDLSTCRSCFFTFLLEEITHQEHADIIGAKIASIAL